MKWKEIVRPIGVYWRGAALGDYWFSWTNVEVVRSVRCTLHVHDPRVHP